jgi:alpha-glucosidase (family GH31 glycosyl hydrolase)
MSVSTTSPSVGLFSNTAAAQDWWIKKNTVNALFNIKVFAAGGIGDHFIFVGGDQTTPAPLQIVKSYNVLFGQPLAPPQWAFGWHQSRWGYNSTDKLREVIAMYKAEELPLDAIWSDVDYMDDYQTFTIGTKHGFADLAEFVEGLHNESLHYVPVIDASIAITPLGDTPYDLSQYLGCLVQGTDGKDFVGRVSANDAVWHDWFHP